MSEFREDFIQGLILLASAVDSFVGRGFGHPVLVGGAAVEFYTGGAVVSGDFDFVTPWHEAFGAALEEVGFRREDRPGWLLRGYYHPELAIGVELVSGTLFDGRADRAKVRLVTVSDDGKAVPIVAVEDLIADRLGQFCSTPQGVKEMLEQAILLFNLAEMPDEDYLDRRIREETDGKFGLGFLRDAASKRK